MSFFYTGLRAPGALGCQVKPQRGAMAIQLAFDLEIYCL